MNRDKFFFIVIVLLATIACKKDNGGHVPEVDELLVKAVPATLVVDENTVVRKASSRLFGFSHNWYQNQRVIMDENDALTIPDDYLNLVKGFRLPMPLNRMAGTESHTFRWKLAIGPLEERSAQKVLSWGETRKQTYGPVEWVKSVREIDPNAEFTWSFNMITDGVQDHVDLVEFLTGDSGNDINGGVNWAAKRVEYGIPGPVNITVWELGNEVDFGELKEKFPIDVYIAECKKIIGEIRKISPDAKFAACGTTALWDNTTNNWNIWNSKVLTELGNEIDYITFHAYYLKQGLHTIDKYMNNIRSDILSIIGSFRVKVYISEHGAWPSNFTDKAYETNDLNGMLGTAEFLNRLFYRPEVAMVAYHNFNAGPWFTINKTDNVRYFSGIADMMKLFNDALGIDIVQKTISGEGTDIKDESCRLTASAMTTEKGLNLILVNRDSNKERDVNFQFANHYKLTKKTVLTADDLLSYNTANKKAINTETTMVNETSDFRQYVVPGKSMVVLYLEKK